MWAEQAVFYQMVPLGLCGAPRENDGVLTSRILKLMDQSLIHISEPTSQAEITGAVGWM